MIILLQKYFGSSTTGEIMEWDFGFIPRLYTSLALGSHQGGSKFWGIITFTSMELIHFWEVG